MATRGLGGRFALHGSLGAVVIFDEKLYVKGHMVNRWMTLLVANFVIKARFYAPMHTGRLREGIDGKARQIGPRQVEGLIASSAPYTMFVLRGTTGPIMSNRAWAAGGAKRDHTGKFLPGMALSFHDYTGRSRVVGEVSGQKANNFLFKAWKATARSHQAIRNINIPAVITGGDIHIPNGI